MDIQKIISEAISTGEIITIVYDGGSQPGTKRQISPISISNSMVRAICLSSNEEKLFYLSKIQVVSNTDSFEPYNPNLQKLVADEPCNLSEILSKHIPSKNGVVLVTKGNKKGQKGIKKERKGTKKHKIVNLCLS